ncbi:MAG: FlgD immunoglobulin-like domain containing protein [Calditrichia bacterium]
MKRLLILALLLLANCVFAQSYAFEWARQGGGVEDDEIWGLAVDVENNYFIAGAFEDVFGLGDTVLTSSGEADIFLAKYNQDSQLLWAKRFGSEHYDAGLTTTTDKEGNVYVGGLTVEEDNEGNTDSNIWFAALTGDGDLLWSEQIRSASNDVLLDMVIDRNGILYLTGEYEGAGSMGGFRLEEFGGSDIFLAAYSISDRRFTHVASTGGPDYDYGLALHLGNSGELVWSGTFYDSASILGEPKVAVGMDDVFVAHLDAATFAVNWLATGGSDEEDAVNGLTIDNNGNVFLAGDFRARALFDGVVVESSGENDVFLAKYDASGFVQWVRQAGGRAEDRALSVAVDASGNSYVTGGFKETVWFDDIEHQSVGELDIFLARYDANGTLLTAVSTGGERNDAATRLEIDGSGSLVMAGVFQAEADFGDTSLVSGGEFDVFIGRLYGADITGILPAGRIEEDFRLAPNYPNPFNPSTTIRFSLEKAADVRLSIYSILGEEIAVLVQGAIEAGEHDAIWDGLNAAGHEVASGMYLYRLQTDRHSETQRMILLK